MRPRLGTLLALALPNQARAQFTGNNQTNVISGVSSNWTGDYYVGSTYVFDALFIQNAGVLSNGAGLIGDAVGANNNIVIVSGSGSVWNNSSSLYVGSQGSGDRLVIRDGGAVVNNQGNVGFYASSSNNSATVAPEACTGLRNRQISITATPTRRFSIRKT